MYKSASGENEFKTVLTLTESHSENRWRAQRAKSSLTYGTIIKQNITCKTVNKIIIGRLLIYWMKDILQECILFGLMRP